MSDTNLCERCGDALPKTAPSIHRRFCSVACRNRANAEYRRKVRTPECPICQRPASTESITCSKACGYKFRKLRLRRPKTCPICRGEFWPVRHGYKQILQTYCSKACYTAKQSERLAMVVVACAYCARTFRRTKGAVKRVDNVFCNRVCASRFLTGENHPNWRGGHDPNRGPSWLKLAASVRKRDDYLCRRCGKTQAENGKKLDVDHIVPWRLFPNNPEAANDPRNLVALCTRCHRIKTAKMERAYLIGDCLGMYAYENSIRLPPLFENYPGTGR